MMYLSLITALCAFVIVVTLSWVCIWVGRGVKSLFNFINKPEKPR